jgi:hypothetical protein
MCQEDETFPKSTAQTLKHVAGPTETCKKHRRLCLGCECHTYTQPPIHRPAKSQKKMTRAWDSVHRVDDQIKQAVITYRTARRAIGELGEAADLEKFQKISKSDLKMSGDIVGENRVGQKSSVLPWFWRLDRKAKGYCGEYEKECEYSMDKDLEINTQ